VKENVTKEYVTEGVRFFVPHFLDSLQTLNHCTNYNPQRALNDDVCL